jgi:hypothetical protein
MIKQKYFDVQNQKLDKNQHLHRPCALLFYAWLFLVKTTGFIVYFYVFVVFPYFDVDY